MDPDRFWKYRHGEDVEVGLAPASNIDIHVLTSVVPTQGGQGVIGPDYELVIIAVPGSRGPKFEVKKVKPQLAHRLGAVVAHRQVALRGPVGQGLGVGR